MKFNPYEPPPIGAAIIQTLISIMDKFDAARCHVTETKLLYLLKKYHGIDICIKTLYRWICFLRKNKYIIGKQYLRVNEGGKTVFGANTYWLLPRAIKYLRSLVGWAKKAFNIYRRTYNANYKRPTDLNKWFVGALKGYFNSFLREEQRLKPSEAFG